MHFIFEGQFSGVILGAFTGVEGTRTKGLLTKLMGAEVREVMLDGQDRIGYPGWVVKLKGADGMADS